MPWEDFWPILVALLGAGGFVLVAELTYRVIRKIVRRLGRRAERRLAQARQPAAAQTDSGGSGDGGGQPPVAGGKPPRGWWAACCRHAERLVESLYRPVQLLAALLGAQAGAAAVDSDVLDPVESGLWDGVALAGIWIGLVAGLWLIALVGGAGWFGSDIGRRFRSQVETLTRVLSVLVFVAIIVIVFIQLDQAQALGSTVLAGAGLIGVVAGLAAQRFLANMFAGMAIGFSDKLNIGDVVEFDGESGAVTARTLTYVVLKLSEQRTLVVPTSQLLDKAHKDWRITKKKVVGWVPLQVDWGVSVPDLLAALRQGYQHHGYGDGDDLRVEVTGVTESAVQVRAMVRATPDDLWDVQCTIRAHLIAWIDSQGTPRPRLRADITRRTSSARATSSTRGTSSTRATSSTGATSQTGATSSTGVSTLPPRPTRQAPPPPSAAGNPATTTPKTTTRRRVTPQRKAPPPPSTAASGT